MTSNQKFVQSQPFSLYGSGAVLGSTSLILTSFVGIDGTLLTMSNFGTIGYATLEPGSGNLEEQIQFTSVTQNINGTATIGGITSIGFEYPYTATSGLSKTHAGAVNFIITNTASFYAALASTSDDETITGLYNFPSGVNNPTIGTTYVAPTLALQIPTKQYVDTVAIQGAPLATTTQVGIVLLSTTQVGTPIVVSTNDTRLPTANEVLALVGTFGTPSATNLYVTNNDTSTSAVVGKLVRTNTNGIIDSSFIPTMNFGTGADGAVVISTNTILTRDYNYTNLTIDNNCTLSPNGFRIFVSGTLTFLGTGVIAANGGNASSGVAGTAANTAGTLPASSAGANGGSGGTSGGAGSAGGNGVSKTNSIGVSGVAGGTATGAAAGTAGTATAAQNNPGLITLYAITMGDYNGAFTLDATSGGGGGGASTGGSTGATGGGSGAPGGIIFVFAQNIVTVNSNTYISANGGTGANGGDSSGIYSGGGGGGSGGIVILGYISKTGTGVISVAGGTGGNAGGSGATGGTNGLTGISYVITH